MDISTALAIIPHASFSKRNKMHVQDTIILNEFNKGAKSKYVQNKEKTHGIVHRLRLFFHKGVGEDNS